ncbi:glycosyl hydrolase family 115 (putative glucuronidase) [Prauserella shujinwangii]|uniref:Glycosyl hydrolase family 115 (Putative glucuronidase) n=1 Tax=Prauserella shujinwangii TaxID=1453103 RepID=A0A2T0LYY4_9PSEU|nr:glycosyl hydrolase 115 family protein [Prauserella shujinwangii]PRX49336.1 glycosyl hydrolase family 115 (putative glucuronidase) [Prauserella shujinwangii]
MKRSLTWAPLRLLMSLLVLASVVVVAPLATTSPPASAAGDRSAPGDYVTTVARPGYFPLVARGRAAPIVVSGRDHPGVQRVAGDLSSDIEKVTGTRPEVVHDQPPARRDIVLVGTLGKSPLVDDLVARGKLDVTGVEGKWETSLQQVVRNPMPGVGRAFVIAGSDQRGTIFGAYDVSKRIGVSPWYWWDDVPPQQHDQLYVKPGRHSQGTPAVKYRGFFINDENPALGTWAPNYFGPGKAPGHPNGFNHKFYAKVFETMLRLKANYLWPAVWGRAFAEDDPLNHQTAKEYGIVMGTSHEAPMMRGIEEWNRHATPAKRDENGEIVEPGNDPYGGTGEWSFRRNAEAIKKYWADGIRRMEEQDFEGVVTLGMRGNGDVALPDGDGIDLMREIIRSEREILADVAGADIAKIPQVFTLYKEVQRYWDKGLRPPDDVTVVFCDDNWGNMRRLPGKDLPERSGGYGLYYHYDYVGGGRNYKWVDTNLLPNIWDQLNQAYTTGVERLWVVNVGDMKNEELPLQFFLDYAWNPEQWPVERLDEWERQYAAQNFGGEHAAEIAEVLHTYANLQSRRKPELLNRRITVDPGKDLSTDPSAVVYDDKNTPFSLVNYREIERVTAEWQRLAARAEHIKRKLPAHAQDAYYQLVYYQVKATANLYELRLAEFKNLLYAEQGRAATNDLADETAARFAEDQAMSDYYNNELADGKWHGFQTQPKIGYGDVERYGPNAPWQQPQTPDHVALPDKVFPEVKRIDVPERAEMGVAVDGSRAWWPQADSRAVLPKFSPFQKRPQQYIEVFNRGSVPFEYRIESAKPWVVVDHARGRVEKEERVTVRINWARAPKGTTTVPITVSGPGGSSVTVDAVVENPDVPWHRLRGFVEASGYVSMEADHATRVVNADGVRWKRIPDIGRTGSGMEPFPVTAPRREPGGDGPRLEYEMTLFTTGPVEVEAYLSPRNDVFGRDGLKYAVSIDDQPPQVVNITEATGADDTSMNKQWERNTSDNVNRTTTTHVIDKPGKHTLKFWMVDPTVVVQKLVVNTGGVAHSYLGPPESLRFGR